MTDGVVGLTAAGLKALSENANDVTGLLSVKRKSAAKILSAKYVGGVISVRYEYNGEKTLSVAVNDVSSSYVLTNETRENKAKKLENELSPKYNEFILAGSSSMENWTSSYRDMLPFTTYNVAIGGTTVKEWANSLAERLIYPYRPRAVVLYVGVNDIKGIAENGGNLSTAGEVTANSVMEFLTAVHERLPDATVYYVLINQIPLAYSNGQNNNYVSQINTANERISAFAADKNWLVTVDADEKMVNANGVAVSSYFTDGIHMTTDGYALWSDAIKKAVAAKEKQN